jgi:HAD superfamily hydrolase (TIGR01509 family)
MWKTVLLDIDGTLLDSNASHAHAWEDAFAEQGYHIPFNTIFPIVGLGGDKLLARLTPGLSDKEGVGKEIAQRRKEIFQQRYLPTVKPTPGAGELVRRIKQAGMTPVVATSAENDELHALLQAAGVADLMEEQANASDASGSKPDPDIVQAALEKSSSAHQESIMIGDTPFDIEAARKAGVAAIAFKSGGHDADLEGALAVYENPADLLAHWDESPLGQTRAVVR